MRFSPERLSENSGWQAPRRHRNASIRAVHPAGVTGNRGYCSERQWPRPDGWLLNWPGAGSSLRIRIWAISGRCFRRWRCANQRQFLAPLCRGARAIFDWKFCKFCVIGAWRLDCPARAQVRGARAQVRGTWIAGWRDFLSCNPSPLPLSPTRGEGSLILCKTMPEAAPEFASVIRVLDRPRCVAPGCLCGWVADGGRVGV